MKKSINKTLFFFLLIIFLSGILHPLNATGFNDNDEYERYAGISVLNKPNSSYRNSEQFNLIMARPIIGRGSIKLIFGEKAKFKYQLNYPNSDKCYLYVVSNRTDIIEIEDQVYTCLYGMRIHIFGLDINTYEDMKISGRCTFAIGWCKN